MINKSINIFCIIICVLLVFPNTLRASETMVINSFVGAVEIKRGAEFIEVKNGSNVIDGDMVKIGEKSALVLVVGQSAKVTVTGPLLYKISAKDLKSDGSRKNILQNFYAFMKGEIKPYYPRTVVSAVRKPKPAYINDLKEANRLYTDGGYDASLLLYEKVFKTPGVPSDMKNAVEFSIAEIYFHRLEVEKAYEIYRRLYTADETLNFQNHEDALARAVFCARILGDEEALKTLSQEYIKTFGDGGKYSKHIKVTE